MQFRVWTYNALRTETIKPAPNAPAVTTQFLQPDIGGILYGISSVSGDRKNPNPQTFRKGESQIYSGSFTDRAIDGSSYFQFEGPQGYTPSYGVSTATADSNVFNEALSKLFDQIRGQNDIALNAMEGREVLHLKRQCDKLETIITQNDDSVLARELKRALKRGWRIPTKKIGNLYLAWQFGLKPIIQDIYNAAETIQRALPSQMVVRSEARSTSTQSIDRDWQNQPSVRERAAIEQSNRVRLRANFVIPDDILTGIGNFTSMNPISLVWEGTPFSFLVDYVYDIGGYMRNLESALLYGNSFQSGYSTFTSQVTGKGSVTGQYTSGGREVLYAWKGWSADKYKERKVMTSVPYPQSPRFKADLGSTRLLNVAALLTNFIKSK